MNLANYYIPLNKIINRFSYYLNWIYYIISPRFVVWFKSYAIIKKINKVEFENRLNFILGDYKSFSTLNTTKYEIDEIIDCANQSLRHEFDYLGSGKVNLDPINWHVDFKSGYTWGKGIFYKKYKLVDSSNNADVKVPWELSRCHHLLWLGQAYLLTNEDKYAKEIIYQINWWIDENPLMYSINWTCAMDVSIRATNWIYALNMVRNSKHATIGFYKKIYKSLFEHGWFIYNNLEKWYPYSANHYAANISGLLFLSQLFQTSSFGKKWYRFALNEYFLEVRLQVLPSGVHFERSISYHRLMTELFGYSFLLLLRIKEDVPIDIIFRIKSMFTFIDNYTKPNGLAPLIGDNDDGRFLPFVRRNFNDHRYLLALSNYIFNQELKNTENTSFTSDVYLLIPNDYSVNSSKTTYSSSAKLSDYRDAGFVIVSSSEFYLFFTNSSLSGYPSLDRKKFITHTHSDMMSFVFSIRDEDIFIDPGTYVYSASLEMRNYFRSTQMHNTASVNHLNHISISEKNYFLVNGFTEPDQISICNDSETFTVSSQKRWIIDGVNLINHFRQLIVNNSSFSIVDEFILTEKEECVIQIYFHLALGVDSEIDKYSNTIKLTTLSGRILTMKFASEKPLDIKILKDNYSPSYGVLDFSKTIQVNIKTSSSIGLKTNILYI